MHRTNPDKEMTALQVQRMVCDLLVSELKLLKPLNFKYLQLQDINIDSDFRECFDLDSLELMRCATAVATLFNIYASGLEDVLLAKRSVKHWCSLVEKARETGTKDLSFMSSGSMGKPRIYKHDWTWLTQEAAAWANKLGKVERIVACVPSHHIYGAIWTCILPNILSVPVIAVTAEKLKVCMLHNNDVLVTVPPVWDHIAATFPLPGSEVAEKQITGISSTSRLSLDTHQRLIENCGFKSVWQIYGSTETAGIAFSSNGDGIYECLDHIRPHTNQSISRTTPQGHSVAQDIPDQIVFSDSTTFSLGSRTDDIVKIGGHRVSLIAVQTSIEQHPKVAQCMVRLDAVHLHLKALVVPQTGTNISTEDAALLLSELDAYFSLKLPAYHAPKAWTLAAALPTNAMGKFVDWTHGH